MAETSHDPLIGVGHGGETWENLALHHKKVINAEKHERLLEQPGELAALEGKVRDVDLTEQCKQHVSQAEVEQTSQLRRTHSPPQEIKAETTPDKPQNDTEANLFTEPDEETKIILVRSLVGGALDTLEGEHSAKLRRASILVILSAMFTHREVTLSIVDDKIGLKYFLDEWLEESDYAEIGWPDRKVWILGLIALIRTPSPRHKAVTDISDRIMTTALDILMEKLHESGSFDSDTDTAESDDDYMDYDSDRYIKGSASNIDGRTSSLEHRALQVQKAANEIIERAKQIKDDAKELMKSDTESKMRIEKTSENEEERNAWTSSREPKIAGETLTHSKTGESVNVLDLPSSIIEGDKSEGSINTAEEMATDSNSSDDDSTYDGEDSSYEEDPELMQYYFALQDANVCSCCLPSLFIDSLEVCKSMDVDWYILLTSNLNSDARNDIKSLTEYSKERCNLLGIKEMEVNKSALAKNTDEVNLDNNNKDDSAVASGNSEVGSYSRHSSSGTDDSMVILSPATSIHAVTKYFKYLKMN